MKETIGLDKRTKGEELGYDEGGVVLMSRVYKGMGSVPDRNRIS
jgi:hypothetical protein